MWLPLGVGREDGKGRTLRSANWRLHCCRESPHLAPDSCPDLVVSQPPPFIWLTGVILSLPFTDRDSLHFSPSLGLLCPVFHDFLFLIYSSILLKIILQRLPEKGCIVKFLSSCIKMPSFFCHIFFLSPDWGLDF